MDGLLERISYRKNLFLTILEFQQVFLSAVLFIALIGNTVVHDDWKGYERKQSQNYPGSLVLKHEIKCDLQACNRNRDLQNIKRHSQSFVFFVCEALRRALCRLENLR